MRDNMGKVLIWLALFGLLGGIWYKAEVILERLDGGPMIVSSFSFIGKDGIVKTYSFPTPKFRGNAYHLDELDLFVEELKQRNR